MMRVSGLSKAGDWLFGQGKARYLSKSDAVGQRVVTRLKSFTNDWYLDVNANVNWIGLLGTRGVRTAQIERQVERVVKATQGVARIDDININLDRVHRSVRINVTITTIYQVTMQLPEVTI